VAQNAAMMIGTTGRVRLPIAFDARALLDDAQALPPEATGSPKCEALWGKSSGL